MDYPVTLSGKITLKTSSGDNPRLIATVWLSTYYYMPDKSPSFYRWRNWESETGGTLFKFTIASKSIPVSSPPKKAIRHKHTIWNKSTENIRIESKGLLQKKGIFFVVMWIMMK